MMTQTESAAAVLKFPLDVQLVELISQYSKSSLFPSVVVATDTPERNVSDCDDEAKERNTSTRSASRINFQVDPPKYPSRYRNRKKDEQIRGTAQLANSQ